jgi:hypothetical protein
MYCRIAILNSVPVDYAVETVVARAHFLISLVAKYVDGRSLAQMNRCSF